MEKLEQLTTLESKLHDLESSQSALESELQEIEADIHEVERDIEKLKAEIDKDVTLPDVGDLVSTPEGDGVFMGILSAPWGREAKDLYEYRRILVRIKERIVGFSAYEVGRVE